MAATFTLPMPSAEAPAVRAFFVEHGFELQEQPHAFWQARGPGCIATFYRSGKLLLQGKEAEVYRGLLGDVSADALPYHAALKLHPKPLPVEWVGTDETGKGDYFGPLVVGGAVVKRDQLELLATLGVGDSKSIANSRIGDLARQVEAACVTRVMVLKPAKYNALHASFGNINKLMAWCHGKIIEELLEATSADFVLVDRFAKDETMKRALGERGKAARFAQRPKAESDPAVAAASIVARAAYLRTLNAIGRPYGMKLPGGAGAPVLTAGRQFIEQHGRAQLGEVAKLHFSTTQQIGG